MTSIQQSQLFTKFQEFLQRRYERERYTLIDEMGDAEQGISCLDDQLTDVCHELRGDDWKEFPETWSLDDHNNRKNDIKYQISLLEDQMKDIDKRWVINENRKPSMVR